MVAAAASDSSVPSSSTAACGARASTRRTKPALSGRVRAVSARTTSAGRSASRSITSGSETAVRTIADNPSRAAAEVKVLGREWCPNAHENGTHCGLLSANEQTMTGSAGEGVPGNPSNFSDRWGKSRNFRTFSITHV